MKSFYKLGIVRTSVFTAVLATFIILLVFAPKVSADSKFETLSLYEVSTATWTSDVTVAPLGPIQEAPLPFLGVGDTLFLNNNLFEKIDQQGQGISPVKGTSRDVCIRVYSVVGQSGLPSNPNILDPNTRNAIARFNSCTISVILPERGQLILQGTIDETGLELGQPQPLAVVGGTEEFQTAHGSGTVTAFGSLPFFVPRLDVKIIRRP